MFQVLIQFIFSFILLQFSPTSLHAEENLPLVKGKYFQRILFVVFENTNYDKALKQPFFNSLAKNGVLFSNFHAIIHPSQGNYIALTSGDGSINHDNNVDLDLKNIVDLLEGQKISWKVYAEGFPGNCFAGAKMGRYVRKHNPFISYNNVRNNPKRCENIVDATHFTKDVTKNLPQYSFYIPDLDNDGHDTGVKYADQWYNEKFSNYFNNKTLMKDTLIVTLFDESSRGPNDTNQIFVSFNGGNIKPGVVLKEKFDTFSLLKMVQENWNLGSLTNKVRDAYPIPLSTIFTPEE
ncbi:MAG: alkaline phosphatase family protein [Bdellovibrionales bacterium]|nr:alkaline phosphatase family protein [Bdellovibrionales bacterium]